MLNLKCLHKSLETVFCRSISSTNTQFFIVSRYNLKFHDGKLPLYCKRCFSITRICLKSNFVRQSSTTKLGDEHWTDIMRKRRPGVKLSFFERLKVACKALPLETYKFFEETKEYLSKETIDIQPGEKILFADFKNKYEINEWDVVTDSYWEQGYSKASLTRSPTGNGLFTGYLDTRVPEDGRTARAGFCNITTKPRFKSFYRKHPHDWSDYTHLLMRVRGDGRTYSIILGTAGTLDLTWTELFSYVLHTRGGPYWQDYRVPFTKFIRVSNARIQDDQRGFQADRINTFGITIQDKIAGNFRLEIDSIQLEYDDLNPKICEYEGYKFLPLHVSI